MLSEEEILRSISQKTETKNLEFKGPFLWKSANDDSKLGLIKDILAMANTQDGGRIIIGVEDGTYVIQGLSDEQWESFDQTIVNNTLHNYTAPQHTCQVFKTSLKNLKIIIIEVPEFKEIPILCQKDGHTSNNPSKQILRSGDIYARTEKATSESIRSADDMRQFLGRALKRKSDDILRSIHDIISGAPPARVTESEAEYLKEMKMVELFFSENFLKRLQIYGSWTVRTYPAIFEESRITDFSELDRLIQASSVDLSGWPFPYTDLKESYNFSKGRQSFTDSEELKKIEGYRAFLSGHFVWKKLLWESMMKVPNFAPDLPVLSFTYAIFDIMEYFIFMERFYSQVCPTESVIYEITLNGTKGRQLISTNTLISFYGPYKAIDDSIQLNGLVTVAELRADWRGIAVKETLKLFQLFNWNTSKEVIKDWHDQFLNRQVRN